VLEGPGVKYIIQYTIKKEQQPAGIKNEVLRSKNPELPLQSGSSGWTGAHSRNTGMTIIKN